MHGLGSVVKITAAELFISPTVTRLRPSDLKFMYEVGLRVPIVPVVTKADTMTIREASIYRAEVANKIANPMLPGEESQEEEVMCFIRKHSGVC